MTEPEEAERSAVVTITPNQQRFASWMTDVLIYTVVLNLFVEYSDAIIIDSFTISVLTAVLLKAILDVLAGVEHRVAHYWQQKDGTINKVLGYISVFGILFFGKLAILEIVDIVFGDDVELGHFIDVVLLIVAMIAVSQLMQWLYRRLGESSMES